MTKLLQLVLLSSVCLAVDAQTTQPAKPPVRPPFRRNGETRIVNLVFNNTKPVPGMPSVTALDFAPCSDDGLTYLGVNGTTSTQGPNNLADIYTLSTTAEVKHLLRKLPIDFDSLSVRDFFAGEHNIVTLLQATRRGQREDDPPRETVWIISLSDHDGDGAKLITLDVKFTPLKVAVTGNGQLMVLGWEPANELPVLVFLKDDGTIRSFVDMDSHNPGATGQAKTQRFSTSLLEAASSTRPGAALLPLQRAAFVAYGPKVLLTFPFSALPVHILTDLGDTGMVTIHLPPGLILHDVLASGKSHSWGVRAQTIPPHTTAGENPTPPELKLFTVDDQTGAWSDLYTFDKPRPEQVTCAAGSKFTALFSQPIAGSDPAPLDANGKPTKPATEWVVSTVYR